MASRKLESGSVISGKYRLIERLGGGGMGDVYRAEHTLAGRIVAFKLLRDDFSDDDDVTRRLFQEAQAVNKIRHPNIVDVLDAGFSEEGPYVVMEILEGLSVAVALERVQRLSELAALAVVIPVLEALDAAHRHGVVHRDLKPENVFLARDEGEVKVKILDFGIAKMMDGPEEDEAARPRTHTGIIFGTPDYLSPEQASGERLVDGRSDVFAAGTVLFELLTGKRPFQAKSAVATAYRVVHEPSPRLSDFGVHADEAVQSALDVAMAKLPEERFADAAAFAAVLMRVAPDGAARRAALRELLDLAVSLAPTTPTHSGVAPAPRPPFAASSSLPPSGPAERAPGSSHPSAPPSSQASLPMPPTMASSLRAPPVSSASLPMTPTPASRVVTSRSSPSWTPRPLPADVLGRCHARGTLVRAVSRWIERGHGVAAHELVLSKLPLEHAEYFRADAFNALVWYELEPADMFVEAATALVLGGDASRWRGLARDHSEGDVGPVFRSTTRTYDPRSVLLRAPAGFRKVFDFGTMRVEEAASLRAPEVSSVMVRAQGFEPTSLSLRYVIAGVLEGLVVACGASEVSSRVVHGGASFLRDLDVEVTWRA